MAYKCIICGTEDVEHQGDVCQVCADGQNTSAKAKDGIENIGIIKDQTSSQVDRNGLSTKKKKRRNVLLEGGAVVSNTDRYGNRIKEEAHKEAYEDQRTSDYIGSGVRDNRTSNCDDKSIKGSSASKEPLATGVVKNLMVDKQKKSSISKLFRTLINAVPYNLDNNITMFQVFPNSTGNGLNSMGYACDQVIVYGKLNAGAISVNNSVEVYGNRDAGNNIVAKKIVNKDSGTTVVPYRTISAGAVWTITLASFALISLITLYLM